MIPPYRRWLELTPLEQLLVGYEYPDADHEKLEWRFLDPLPDSAPPYRVQPRDPAREDAA